jgi:hypothetical protein
MAVKMEQYNTPFCITILCVRDIPGVEEVLREGDESL